jgi:hypothetical protein
VSHYLTGWGFYEQLAVWTELHRSDSICVAGEHSFDCCRRNGRGRVGNRVVESVETLDNCLCCIVYWWSEGNGVDVSSDGRVMVTEGGQSLVIPSPAATIWTDICARKAVNDRS